MNGLLFDPSGTDGRVIMEPGVGNLTFVVPLDRDEGVYQCQAISPLGTALSVRVDFRYVCK